MAFFGLIGGGCGNHHYEEVNEGAVKIHHEKDFVGHNTVVMRQVEEKCLHAGCSKRRKQWKEDRTFMGRRSLDDAVKALRSNLTLEKD